MKNKVFGIFANNGDTCLMLVNSTNCSSAVKLAKQETDMNLDTDFYQAEEISGIVHETDEECIIKIFDSDIDYVYD